MKDPSVGPQRGEPKGAIQTPLAYTITSRIGHLRQINTDVLRAKAGNWCERGPPRDPPIQHDNQDDEPTVKRDQR